MTRPISPMEIVRPSNRTGRPGGQEGNTNAVRHGGFSGVFKDMDRRNLDQRTKLAKSLKTMETELLDAIEGTPSPQQRLLAGRIAFKAHQLAQFEGAVLNGDDSSPAVFVFYLSWAGSLRQDLQALGLEGVAPPTKPEDAPLIRVVLVANDGSTRPASAAQAPKPTPEPRPERQRVAEPVEAHPVAQTEPQEPPQPRRQSRAGIVSDESDDGFRSIGVIGVWP